MIDERQVNMIHSEDNGYIEIDLSLTLYSGPDQTGHLELAYMIVNSN